MNKTMESKTKKPMVLKVGSRTNMPNLIKAIIGNIKNDGVVHCDSMGPNAVFLCNKALIYAANLLKNERINIAVTPTLVDVAVDNPSDNVRVKTALRWTIRVKS